MISVHWDTSLPPITSKTPEEEEIARWDEWFELVGIGEEWEKIKEARIQIGAAHHDVITWARITELTRLGTK